MPTRTAPLTEMQVRKAKPAEKSYRLADGKGLYLEVMPNGSKYWRMKYRFDGKEKRAAFGVYPEVSLAEARQACLAARKLLAAGTDPTEQKREVKRARAIEASSSFEAVAREWFESQKDGWTEVYADKVINSLEVDVFPRIGTKPIRDIEAPAMLEILRAIEARGVRETAKRVLQRSRAVFQYGIMTGRCSRNPAADIDAETVLKKGPGVQHMARVKPVEIPQLMRDIEAYSGDRITLLALRFMALTFVRTKEMITAGWDEIDEKAAEWRIPAERMKMRDPHIVPLSREALETLAEPHRSQLQRVGHAAPERRVPALRPPAVSRLLQARRMGQEEGRARQRREPQHENGPDLLRVLRSRLVGGRAPARAADGTLASNPAVRVLRRATPAARLIRAGMARCRASRES